MRQEPLDLPRPGYFHLVILGQYVHTEDGYDVLKGFVILQEFLDASGHVVVLMADDVGVHDKGGHVERIHGGVNPPLG